MSGLSDQRRYYERMIDEIADAHREQLDQLKAENARLKQELESVGTAAYLYGRTDLADENAKLRELMYERAHKHAIHHMTEDELRITAANVMAENAKLRERAVAMLSELRGVVSEGDYDSPSGRYFLLRRDVAAYEDALRELGIEV